MKSIKKEEYYNSSFLVEVTRLELATSRSLTVRATNLRYTSIGL